MAETPTRERQHAEEVRIEGDYLWAKIKQLVREGNHRSVVIQSQNGRTVISFPLTIAVIATVVAPALVLVAALTAFTLHHTIIIVRKDS